MSNKPAEPSPVPPANVDVFGRAIATITVAQIGKWTGFHTARRTALDALSDHAIRYISDLGHATNFHAGLSGRNESNVFDITQALEDLGAGTAAEVLGKTARNKSLNDDIPFTHPLPTFLISQNVLTPVWNKRLVDHPAEKMEQGRKAEKSLKSLQKWLACNGDGLPHSSSSSIRAETPVPVTLDVVDTEERFHMVEAFASAIDAAKDERVRSGTDERRVPILE